MSEALGMSDAVSRVKEKVSEMGTSAGEALHSGRMATAGALDNAAKGLHSKAERAGRAGHEAADTVNRVGHDAADRIDVGAKYVRSHGAKEIMADVEHFVKNNPGKSLIAAAAVGFLVGRSLRSAD